MLPRRTPNISQTEARKALDPEVGNNPMFYPDAAILEKTEVFITLDNETNTLQKNLWTKLKTLKD